jgi:hypothetical protein
MLSTNRPIDPDSNAADLVVLEPAEATRYLQRSPLYMSVGDWLPRRASPSIRSAVCPFPPLPWQARGALRLASAVDDVWTKRVSDRSREDVDEPGERPRCQQHQR